MAKQYRAVDGSLERSDWMPFLKQIHISSATWSVIFMHGLATGAPTVFVPQIRKDWTSTVIDDDLASWFYSAINFAAVPWIFIIPILSHYIGRKILYLANCAALTAVNLLLYFSTAPYHILIAQAIHGFVCASSICMLIHIIPEYCNHRYRSFFLNVQVTTFFWGLWTSNAIGTFFHWKYIAVFGLICAVYSFTVCLYPESPRWLASKGKVSECEAAYKWIHGSGDEAEKELRDLIKSSADYAEDRLNCAKLRETLICKQFYKPLFIITIVGFQYNFSGKFIFSIYAIEILKRVTENESTAYTGMLILDGVTVFGMYAGSILSKFVKRRPLFLYSSLISLIVMLALALYLYLVKLEVIDENNIITLGLLVIYSLAISSGPIILCSSIYGEIVPIRYHAVSFVISSFIFLVSCTTMLKFTPLIFNDFGVHGSFLFYAITFGIATGLLLIYMPETKDKTLVEIEEYFKDEKVPEAEALTHPMKSAAL